MEYTMIPKLFDHVITRELPVEILDELEYLGEKGTLSDPGSSGLKYMFIEKIKKAVDRSAKLFGVSVGNNKSYDTPLSKAEESAILTSLLLQTYPNFDLGRIEESFKPRKFIVGSESTPLPFVGGSRQGELEGIYYDDIEAVFGKPTWKGVSGDNKVQVEWDIKFDNGVRSSIYDYKQYDVDPYDIDYWSVGGNSPESAFEVYKVMGLI
jgi:hypothetical protein|tara:strand:+ start:1213 stop:1839 length:627 start_codon:yes stop_codon:yes gene_type:complete